MKEKQTKGHFGESQHSKNYYYFSCFVIRGFFVSKMIYILKLINKLENKRNSL